MTDMKLFVPACCALLLCSACGGDVPRTTEAAFVGRPACAPCHATELAAFAGSDHDRAMDSATEATVLGNFNNAEFTEHGVTTTFFRRDGRFYVRTESESGTQEEYPVSYTFGVQPLQQYLVAFPGGRYQALPFCWDTRPADAGGQRWFHIYGHERIAPTDELFWTRVSQNWNYQCAECHSTNLKKNYSAATRTYATTWSEIDVSCEACHGAGSRHVEWAKAPDQADTLKWPRRGLEVQFERRDEVEWQFQPGDSIASRTTAGRGASQVEMCARCHSRRSTMAEYTPGRSLLQTHYPAFLESPLYYPDGQIREEVYEYGSFLQSKMHKAGVVCSDCHNVHSGKLQAEGNALCQRCHQAETYAAPTHHFHKADSPGAQCVSCHMPERTYMVVDPRADHSLRVPRPDLTVALGVPNACNNCHSDRSATWAAEWWQKWYGAPKPHPFALEFEAAERGDRRAAARLGIIAYDSTLPAIVRASALELQNSLAPAMPTVVLRAQSDVDPLLRVAAALAAPALPPDSREPILSGLLSDSVLLVRAMAARSFTELPRPPGGRPPYAVRDSALADYVRSQLYNADFPSSWMNVSNLYLASGDTARTRQALETAIAIDSTFTPAYVNLADLYRERGLDREGRDVLEAALRKSPEDAGVIHALGLLLVRSGRYESALEHLKRAHEADPQNARYAYVYASGLQSQGQMEAAVQVARDGLKAHPYDRGLLDLLMGFQISEGDRSGALATVQMLKALYPEVEDYGEMETRLKGS